MMYAIAITLLVLFFFMILYIGKQSNKRDSKISFDRMHEDPNSSHHH